VSTPDLYVYIMASLSRRLYTGVTRDLFRRVSAHKQGLIPGHTKRYRITRLVYYERAGPPLVAISREKQIKSWTRSKRTALIESMNPGWLDLAADWFPADKPAGNAG
jgi:putative endonuclease